MTGHISDTAFLVNESRARRADVSRDVYARHWVLPERREAVSRLWDDFAREVYPHDDLELSIRNRFFLDQVRSLVARGGGPVLINVGAGFSSYPLLLEEPVACVEVDLPAVIELKRQRMAELVAQGIVPERPLTLVALDLESAEGIDGLADLLSERAARRPSFILLEGITYYLKLPTLQRLFDLFRATQQPESPLAFDFWRPEIVRHPVFQRLQEFFARRFTFQTDDYTLFDETLIEGIEGYRVETITDAAEQEERYAGTRVLRSRPEAILEENYAVLRRSS